MNDPTEFIYCRSNCQQLFGVEPAVYDTQYFPYVLCFSSLIDNILMWRLYKAKVCLVLEKEKIRQFARANGKFFASVQYPHKEKSKIEDAIQNIAKELGAPIMDDISEEAQIFSCFIKHPDFKDENETRLVALNDELRCFTYTPDGPGEIPPREDDNEFETSIREDGTIRKYKEIVLPPDTIKEVFVYMKRSKHSEFVKKKIEELFLNNGYPNKLKIHYTKSVITR